MQCTCVRSRWVHARFRYEVKADPTYAEEVSKSVTAPGELAICARNSSSAQSQLSTALTTKLGPFALRKIAKSQPLSLAVTKTGTAAESGQGSGAQG